MSPQPNHPPRQVRATLRRILREGEGLAGSTTRRKAARKWREMDPDTTAQVLEGLGWGDAVGSGATP